MTTSMERLYQRLPAIYRKNDEMQGQPLRALLQVIEQELIRMEQEISQAYDNCFVETCQPQFIAPLADLLAGRELLNIDRVTANQRRLLAKLLHYRRRKGQASTLANVIKDLTGWPAKVVEYSNLIATTQHSQCLRLDNNTTVAVRDDAKLATLLTPFENLVHTAQISTMGRYANYYKLDTIGVYVWRGSCQRVQSASAGRVAVNCYTFHPFGQDLVLVNGEQNNAGWVSADVAAELAIPLQNKWVKEDLLQHQTDTSSYFYGPGQSFCLYKVQRSAAGYQKQMIALAQLRVMDLSEWPLSLDDNTVLVDLERGRIYTRMVIDELWVDYHYAVLAPMGGGYYDRRDLLQTTNPNTVSLTVCKGESNQAELSLTDALLQYDTGRGNYLIEITDSHTYEIVAPIALHGRSLTIQAADNCRPCIKLTQPLLVDNSLNQTGRAKLTLNGIWVSGTIQLTDNIELTVQDCTLLPSEQAAIHAVDGGHYLQVNVLSSISGAICLPSSAQLSITDSIIDGKGGPAIAGNTLITDSIPVGPSLNIQRTTVLGGIWVAEIVATAMIAAGKVTLLREDRGSVRYSYLLNKLPNCENCYWPSESNATSLNFITTEYGKLGYAQLSQTCSEEISKGAVDGLEMGAYNRFSLAERENKLQEVLDDYLPYSTPRQHITLLPEQE